LSVVTLTKKAVDDTRADWLAVLRRKPIRCHAGEALFLLENSARVLAECEASIARATRTADELLDPEVHAIHDAFARITVDFEAALACLRTQRQLDWKDAYGEVISSMAGDAPASGEEGCMPCGKAAFTGGDPEPQPLRHLRSYTSFLAPSLGITLDTFTLGAIVMRNLFVNWTMLIPALFVVVGLTEWSGFLLLKANRWLTYNFARDTPLGTFVAVSITLLFLIAAIAAAAALPSHYKIPLPRLIRRFSKSIFFGAVVVASWLLTASGSSKNKMVHWSKFLPNFLLNFISNHISANIHVPALLATAPIALVGFGALSFSIFLAYRERITRRNAVSALRINDARAMVTIAAVVTSLVISSLIGLLQSRIFPFLLAPGPHHHARLLQLANGQRLYIVFALPTVITLLLLTTSLFCALLGIYEMEEDREWWVRSGGWFLAFNIIWMVAHGIAFYGQAGWHTVVAGISGLVLGLAGSAVGYSGVTSAGPRPVKVAQLSGVGQFLEKHHLVLPGVGGVSLLLIGLGAVAAEESIRVSAVLPMYRMSNLQSAFLMTLISAAFAVLINFAININLFSLHGMYRMRLMRAFLGASNVFRRPDPFTNFDPRDTPYETDLPSTPGVPLHVINTTLNLVGTRNTAWHQRKAESFTFSPIHCGCWRLGYVPSSIYGGSRGVSVATAMSISGAAFNPNMGYQSSPLLALLMTFFNLRLGFWLPNPAPPQLTPSTVAKASRSKLTLAERGERFYSKPGPIFALQPLLEEALGLTDDTSRWIELTDGGHFENLGLYEMVMRRCKNIIVVDAGADPKCQFEDLGNAIRKIYIDLGVPIRFPKDLKMKPGMVAENSYCAVAEIDYGCVDPKIEGERAVPLVGRLVYIKASVTGREPVDVLQYAMTHDAFPHEATSNQFFNESQFESYRHLGSYVVDCINSAAKPSAKDGINTFADAANDYWMQVDQKHAEAEKAEA
jgi:hypothetical protein